MTMSMWVRAYNNELVNLERITSVEVVCANMPEEPEVHMLVAWWHPVDSKRAAIYILEIGTREICEAAMAMLPIEPVVDFTKEIQ